MRGSIFGCFTSTPSSHPSLALCLYQCHLLLLPSPTNANITRHSWPPSKAVLHLPTFDPASSVRLELTPRESASVEKLKIIFYQQGQKPFARLDRVYRDQIFARCARWIQGCPDKRRSEGLNSSVWSPLVVLTAVFWKLLCFSWRFTCVECTIHSNLPKCVFIWSQMSWAFLLSERY